MLVSIGILLAGAAGSWDITNHLLNKPETFFAPPHAVLYSGVAIAVAGAAMLFTALDVGDFVWTARAGAAARAAVHAA